MPLYKTFWSRYSGFLPTIVVAMMMAGCMAVDESRQLFDVPLADDFQPTISRDKSFTPRRILVLPVTGQVDPGLRTTFELEMLNGLKKPNYWTIVEYSQPGAGGNSIEVDHYSAYHQASQVKADAILYVNLSDHSIYDPIHFSTTVTMERVDNQSPALNGRFDFDTRDRNVADSARRYYQQNLARTYGDSDAPDKSLYILHNNDPFFKFAGAYTAKLIADPYRPPVLKDGTMATPPPEASPTDAKPPTPPFDK